MTDWIEWHGGENPAPGKMVDVRFRDGGESMREPADDWNWGFPPSRGRKDSHSDIIAYRILQGEAEKSSEAHDTDIQSPRHAGVGNLSDLLKAAKPQKEAWPDANQKPVNHRTLKPGDRGTITLGFEVGAPGLDDYGICLAFDGGKGLSAILLGELDAATIHLTPPVEKAWAVGDAYITDDGSTGTILGLHEGRAWILIEGSTIPFTTSLNQLRRAS